MLNISFLLSILLCVSACQKESPKGARERVFVGGALPAILHEDAHNYAVDTPDVGTKKNSSFDYNGKTLWRAKVGMVSNHALLEQGPVVTKNLIITIDVNGVVMARGLKDGALKWSLPTLDKKEEYRVGGGMCVYGERLYVATPLGRVVSVDTVKGRVLWSADTEVPLRSPPVANGRFVFVTTVINGLLCLDAKNGARIWGDFAQEGQHSIVGGAPPVLLSGNVLVGHTTGEVSALRQENGHVHWRNSMNPESDNLLLEDFLSWKAPFVYSDTSLYLVHPAGVLLSADLRNGAVQWKLGAGYLYAPAIGQNVLFVVDMFGHMVCVEKVHGKVLWIADLPLYENPMQKLKRPIYWAGPVLAGDRLMLAGTDGSVLTVSPKNGKILDRVKLSKSAFYLPPVVVDRVAYFLDQSGEVIART